MKKIILALVLLLSVLLSGCYINVGGYYRYSKSGKYSTLDKPVSGNVTKLEIDWLNGDIEIVNGDMLSISEEFNSQDVRDEHRLRYWLDGTVLHIKFVESGAVRYENLSKDLKIIIPSDLTELDVDTVSADITVSGITAREFDSDTVSGRIDLINVNIKRINIDSVSGGADMSFGNSYPDKIDFDSVSGNLELTLDKDASFTAKLDSVSGRLRSDISVSVQRNKYIAGNGSGLNIDFDSVSGDLVIKVE